MIRKICFYLGCNLLLVAVTHAQTSYRTRPIDRALITHIGGTVTVDAREPRPLRQAVEGVRSEYGWLVDYEDPIYDKNKDVVNDTNAQWKADHPLAPSVTRLAGERFVFSAEEPSAADLKSGQATSKVLAKMLDSYNETTNPGKFKFRDEGNKRFAVVGDMESQGLSGLFDCKIVLTKGTLSIDEAINAIFQLMSKQVGKQVRLGFAPINLLFRQTSVDSDGNNISARVAFAKALDDTKVNLVYEALFDVDSDFYMVNIYPALKNTYDISGQRASVLLRQR